MAVQVYLHGYFYEDKRSASVISTNTLDILVLIDTKELYLESELGRRRYDAQRNEQQQIDDSVKKKQKKQKLCRYHQMHGLV